MAGLLGAFAVAAPGAHGAVVVNHPDFADVSDLGLNGSAAQATDVLRLTTAGSDLTGSAFTLASPLSHKKSWKTEFSFSMHDTTTAPGDGMAFVAQTVGISVLGDGGGGLGYGSVGDSVAVEFDTFDNGGGNEAANEVAVATNGKAGRPIAREEAPFALYGGVRYAWIKYSAGTERLRVWVNDDEEKPSKALLSAKRNLKHVLGGKAHVGFTAATGGATEVHDVLSWKLSQ